MNSDNAPPQGLPAQPKILIVDDDPFQVQLLESILIKEQYATVACTDSKKAIAEAADIDPDLILLDLIMPDIDGFEVCRYLKSDPRTRHIPVIFVTAKKDQATESEGFELGAVDYITKPFNPIVIRARIRNQLELKGHRDSLELLVRERTDERDKSQQQFRDLVEKSLVGIAIIQENELVYQNPELERTVPGLEEKIRCMDFGFIHPENLTQLTLAYQNMIKEDTFNMEADLRISADVQNGTEQAYKWVNFRASTFNYQGGEAILINLVDITHTKELEKLLLNRNKMASLGRIASGMAHEIRNPLTGITSYLYSLDQICASKTMLPKDIELMQEIVGQLKKASHKVEAVIKRVLDFSKPTTPQMMRIDVNQCLDNVLGLTAATMRKAGIEITTALEKKLPNCYGDVALIEQVILNLIQNAGRALKEVKGMKKIAVSSYAHDNSISIAISDSGHGVPKDLRDKIFDPFFTTNPDGSGIGLSIAQRIVTDHSGSITVENSQLGGAHFTVTLPIEKRRYPR
jgi:signal transduction histidine kinase/DNA-binding response OmpR family regulator